jgi:hypothetical protein
MTGASDWVWPCPALAPCTPVSRRSGLAATMKFGESACRLIRQSAGQGASVGSRVRGDLEAAIAREDGVGVADLL